MKYAEFISIRRLVQDGVSPPAIAEAHPTVLYDAIVSVWSAHWQERELRALRTMRHKSGTGKEECASRFRDGESLHTIAASLGVSPCALARELLAERGLNKTQIKEVIKRPETLTNMRIEGDLATATAASSDAANVTIAPPRAALPAAPATARSSSRMYDLLRTISLERWSDEVRLCVDNDEHNSPFLDTVKHLTGSEYETLLESHLTALGVPFETERALRLAGKSSKTPDFVLRVPLLIHGHVVNWIDSKAHFADPTLKREHIEGQLRQYVNRDGTGMVIYWHDFVEDEPNSITRTIKADQLQQAATLTSSHAARVDTAATGASEVSSLSLDEPFGAQFASPALDEDGQILVVTHFPTDIVTMDDLLLRDLRPHTTTTASTERHTRDTGVAPVSLTHATTHTDTDTRRDQLQENTRANGVHDVDSGATDKRLR